MNISIKQKLVNIIHNGVKPVTSQPFFFILIYVLLNALDIFSIITFHSLLPFFKVFSGLLYSYILCLPIIFFSFSFRKFYKGILLLIAVAFWVVDVYCIVLYQETFFTMHPDSIAAILATNISETIEYIIGYITFDRVLMALLSLTLLLSFFYCFNKLHFKWSLVTEGVLFILIVFSCIFSISKVELITSSNLYYFFTYKCYDLRDYRQNPYVRCREDRPDNVVLVIGESFAKSHSSLYGYNKSTNPLLEKMKVDSLLYVYSNVTSAYTTTIPVFKSIMTSYTEDIDSIEWYQCLTIFDVMQNAGYKTFWISNQSKYGLYDNEVGRFADLCNDQAFVGDMYSGIRREEKDMLLLPFIDKFINQESKKLFIIHLMGSHSLYSNRYPAEYSKYKAEDYSVDYPQLSPKNRKVLSEYDNSILYNDSVVYEIFNKYKDQDAIVIYFSDHGQDIFDTSDDYYGHAVVGNEKSERVCREIPFMIYTTSFFRDRHRQLQQRIENSVNNTYRTDSIMYTIMDIAGVEIVNGVSYKHKSLLN